MTMKLKPLAFALCLTGVLTMPVTTLAAHADDENVVMQTNTQNLHTIKKHHKKKHHHVKNSVVVPADKIAVLEKKASLPLDIDVPGQAFVSTGPYVGVPLQFAGGDLIINSPSVNLDVQILKVRKSIDTRVNELIASGIKDSERHSHLLFSGIVEAQAGVNRTSGASTSSDIDLTNVSLDALVVGPSEWTSGLIELTFDNGLPFTHYFREANSNVFVNKAFITIGNLLKTPFYGTVGQYYVPFGAYSSVMVSDPLTKTLGRTKSRAITLGYNEADGQGLMASIFGFRGDTRVGSSSRIDNGGFNAIWRVKGDVVSADFGGGLIANIADSVGMQFGTGFNQYERISHRVPAYNVRGIFHYGDSIDVIAEVISATQRFSMTDMTFNSHGAKPWASDVEVSYAFTGFMDKPSSIGLGYGHSKDALAMYMPQNTYSAVFNTSFWRNTVQSLEFRHELPYAQNNSATGPAGANGGAGVPVVNGNTHNNNSLIAQIDYYF